MADKRPNCNVIIADDFMPDLDLLVLALKRVTHFSVVLKAQDGGEVIDYLAAKTPFHDREIFPRPHLLILDLKMLKTDGFDVLKWVRDHYEYKLLSVVVTGVDNQNYCSYAKSLGASMVLVKPITMTNVNEIVGEVERFVEQGEQDDFF